MVKKIIIAVLLMTSQALLGADYCDGILSKLEKAIAPFESQFNSLAEFSKKPEELLVFQDTYCRAIVPLKCELDYLATHHKERIGMNSAYQLYVKLDNWVPAQEDEESLEKYIDEGQIKGTNVKEWVKSQFKAAQNGVDVQCCDMLLSRINIVFCANLSRAEYVSKEQQSILESHRKSTADACIQQDTLCQKLQAYAVQLEKLVIDASKLTDNVDQFSLLYQFIPAYKALYSIASEVTGGNSELSQMHRKLKEKQEALVKIAVSWDNKDFMCKSLINRLNKELLSDGQQNNYLPALELIEFFRKLFYAPGEQPCKDYVWCIDHILTGLQTKSYVPYKDPDFDELYKKHCEGYQDKFDEMKKFSIKLKPLAFLLEMYIKEQALIANRFALLDTQSDGNLTPQQKYSRLYKDIVGSINELERLLKDSTKRPQLSTSQLKSAFMSGYLAKGGVSKERKKLDDESLDTLCGIYQFIYFLHENKVYKQVDLFDALSGIYDLSFAKESFFADFEELLEGFGLIPEDVIGFKAAGPDDKLLLYTTEEVLDITEGFRERLYPDVFMLQDTSGKNEPDQKETPKVDTNDESDVQPHNVSVKIDKVESPKSHDSKVSFAENVEVFCYSPPAGSISVPSPSPDAATNVTQPSPTQDHKATDSENGVESNLSPKSILKSHTWGKHSNKNNKRKFFKSLRYGTFHASRVDLSPLNHDPDSPVPDPALKVPNPDSPPDLKRVLSEPVPVQEPKDEQKITKISVTLSALLLAGTVMAKRHGVRRAWDTFRYEYLKWYKTLDEDERKEVIRQLYKLTVLREVHAITSESYSDSTNKLMRQYKPNDRLVLYKELLSRLNGQFVN